MTEITVGIDIGTSSVKAIAADSDGRVVARSRVPHQFHVPSPLCFEHDAALAWRAGPQRALAELGDVRPRAVSVAAMVPSLTAVDAEGVPCTPGLLYGDERGAKNLDGVAESGELMTFLRWQAHERPEAHGYWMAQAVANHALSGRAVVSEMVGMTAYPMFDGKGWDAEQLASAGRAGTPSSSHRPARASTRCPSSGSPVGRSRASRPTMTVCSTAASSMPSANSSLPEPTIRAMCSSFSARR
jgi:xylulokinase